MHLAAHMPDASEQLRPRLLEQVRNALRRKHYSLRTEYAYIQWIKRFIHFTNKTHPAAVGHREVTAFLNHLAVNDMLQRQPRTRRWPLYYSCIKRRWG